MAGNGVRFQREGYTQPKPLIDVFGLPLIHYVLQSLDLQGEYVFIVRPLPKDQKEKLHNILNSFAKKVHIIELDHETRGPADTCLYAKDLLIGKPVISVNCDQIMNWDGKKFQEHCLKSKLDGVVVTYPENTPKNSYVRLDSNGMAVELREKSVISPHSLNGIHYWRDGKLMVDSMQAMISANDRTNNEFYIAPSYNYLIQQKAKIGIYEISKQNHFAVGTPTDLNVYMEFKKKQIA